MEWVPPYREKFALREQPGITNHFYYHILLLGAWELESQALLQADTGVDQFVTDAINFPIIETSLN